MREVAANEAIEWHHLKVCEKLKGRLQCMKQPCKQWRPLHLLKALKRGRDLNVADQNFHERGERHARPVRLQPHQCPGAPQPCAQATAALASGSRSRLNILRLVKGHGVEGAEDYDDDEEQG